MDVLEQKGVRLVVHLPSDVDHHCTEELRKMVDETLKREPIQELELDFSQTLFMDSAGIGMILGRYKLMRALGGRLMVSHMSRQIHRILLLSGIQNHIRLEGEDEQ